MSEIERLAARLTAPKLSTTLGGCLIISDHAILIAREPGRTGLPQLDLIPGRSALWDARFHAALAAQAPGPCSVRALTPDEWTALRGMPGILQLPAHTALALPTFWHAGQLVAVPGLGPLTHTTVLEQQLHSLAPDERLRSFEPLCTAKPASLMDKR